MVRNVKRLTALGTAMLLAGVLSAQAVEVINVDFEGGDDGGVSIVANAAAAPVVTDDGCGNNYLQLTQTLTNQGAWAWFPDQFDLNNNRVEIEFDLYIMWGDADTTTPADGISVIFQFDNDLNATGDAGGGLGVGNFRQNNSPYVGVGFDIWDNGAVDVETPCDGAYGSDGASSCHVEVNQNIDPENVASQRTNVDEGASCPDYIASGSAYGTPTTPNSCDTADLIHVNIIFDNRLMVVTLDGGVYDEDGDGIPAERFPETTVINYATQPFPPRESNIGFAASTGARFAWQGIDNIVVREGPSAVEFVTEGPRTEGGVNCGGGAVDASAEISQTFEADRFFGDEISRTGDLINGLVITAASMGRIDTGANNTSAPNRPVDLGQIAGAGASTQQLFNTLSWSTNAVLYEALVNAGRYDVSLYFQEDCTCGVNSFGQGTKIFDVLLNGERVLKNWSPGSAAGSPTGSGDPLVPCTAVLDVGIVRNFSVDVADSGDGTGTLQVLVDDLGGGNPPENAVLTGFYFSRGGDTTGQPVSGDIELLGKPEGPDPTNELVNTDFEDDVETECPEGWTCNTNAYQPQIVFDIDSGEQRLRLIDDTVGSTASTAIYNQTVNVCDAGLTAEFDLYMRNLAGNVADGGTFFVMQGTNVNALGGAGGALGIPGGIGFAVEFDTWNGGSATDCSGYNIADAWTHVGINNLSTDSVVTNCTFDPELRPTGTEGWPNFLDPAGVHVIIEYNAGHVAVTLEGTQADLSPFGPTLVAEGEVFPIQSTEAVVGFSAGTGGETQDMEIDNLLIMAEEGEPGSDPVSEALRMARERWNEGRGELYVNAGGPTLACDGNQFPISGSTGEAGAGDQVVWVGDTVGGGTLTPSVTDFFTVSPLPNLDGSNSGLQIELNSSMSNGWDARGTAPGVDDNDRMFHTERWADHQYDIPVQPGAEYEVTLYFANSCDCTAGTARRFFHVEINGIQQEGDELGGINDGEFGHCPNAGYSPLGGVVPNPVFGFGNLYDPVDHAEQVYSANPCELPGSQCAANGVTSAGDPDGDTITAPFECGNAAGVALRYTVSGLSGGGDSIISIALTEPDTGLGEPGSPDSNPKISGLSLRCLSGCEGGGPRFVRSDTDGSGTINLTDGVATLQGLFAGRVLPCLDAADADDRDGLNLTDGVRVFLYLFSGGATPPPPSPDMTTASSAECGDDPTDDPVPGGDLGCETEPTYCQ